MPFFFELDDSRLPDNVWDLFHRTLPNEVRQAEHNSHVHDRQLLPTLRRLQALGRITLLLDSIDQAGAAGLLLVQDLLRSADWNGCPIVISARPHAIFDQWKDLIVPDETTWRFVRVEPLAEQQRELLLNQKRSEDGIDRYAQLPAGGKELMANPRNIEYVRKCKITNGTRHREDPKSIEKFTLGDLKTASHVFAGAVDHLVRLGMNAEEARKLKRPKDKPPPKKATQRQIDFALNLLGALAYTMYRMPAPGKRKKGHQFRPNVSHVPAERMPWFTEKVLQRLKGARVVKRNYQIDDLEDDLEALAALNAAIHFDLLDTSPNKDGDFRWYDRSLQEFFAAWWLSRYAGPRDHEKLRQWRYDDPRDETGRTLFQPLWGFLVEMPRAVRKDAKWVPAVGVLFEHKVPRCCEMIYRTWTAMERSKAGVGVIREWQKEFEAMLDPASPQREVARQIPDGFRRCPRSPDKDNKPFQMGSPPDEYGRGQDEFPHSVVVSPFRMHQFPVTNAQYELFDLKHKDERWGDALGPRFAPHPAGEEAKDHPVVFVTWFQAWCFARWTGNHLPTEAQWESACRGGVCPSQIFNVGDSLSSTQANFDGRNPYGKVKPGPYLECTSKVGSYTPNRFLLYDMHGNVWEWCQDWYAKHFSETEKARLKDPVNDEAALTRVLRGGSWSNGGWVCRSAYRSRQVPNDRSRSYGFRLAAVPADFGAK